MAIQGDAEGSTPLGLAVLALFARGLTTAGFAVPKWLPISCILIFLAGTAVMASASVLLSLVQLIVVDSMRGRVMSVYNLGLSRRNTIRSFESWKADSYLRRFNRYCGAWIVSG